MTNTVRAFYKNGAGPTLLETAADVDALVDAVLAEPFENSVITLYSTARPLMESGVPDHEMRAALYAEAKVGGIRYAGDDSTKKAVGTCQAEPASVMKSSTTTKDRTRVGRRTQRFRSTKYGQRSRSS